MKKVYSEYHKEYYGTKHKARKRFFIIFLIILFIALFLLLFYNEGIITNKVINTPDPNNSIDITTYFSIPDISLDDEYEEVRLYIDKGVVINLDNKEINLEENKNFIVLKDFKGKIKFNETNLKELTGKISGIRINGLPITLQKKGNLKISISNNPVYSFFEIKEKVYLKKISLVTSGTINVKEDVLSLDSERVEIKNYLGSITIKDKKLILEGIIESLNIEGDFRKLNLYR